MLTPAVYGHMTQMLLGLASGKLVLALEVSKYAFQGGYNFKVSTDCMSSCVSVLLGEACQNVKSCIPSARPVWIEPGMIGPYMLQMDSICSTLDVHKQYWKSLKFRVNLPTEEQINKIKKKKNSCDKKDEKKDNHFKPYGVSLSKRGLTSEGELRLMPLRIHCNLSLCSKGFTKPAVRVVTEFAVYSQYQTTVQFESAKRFATPSFCHSPIFRPTQIIIADNLFLHLRYVPFGGLKRVRLRPLLILMTEYKCPLNAQSIIVR
ncbi:hypothetical protein KUTeg_020738 [Tegillarca granosa]|uniref:Uncharacterized protein n=1 Tax=Tegillarca granosa TaxID=220873 RepID=A0ABQ9ED47_TEGGR|nr:hypothetical protein KUTeg_020738 [Tegillarca granosa]